MKTSESLRHVASLYEEYITYKNLIQDMISKMCVELESHERNYNILGTEYYPVVGSVKFYIEIFNRAGAVTWTGNIKLFYKTSDVIYADLLPTQNSVDIDELHAVSESIKEMFEDHVKLNLKS